MNIDKELLELAAKAAGIPIAVEPFFDEEYGIETSEGWAWSPLTDDGDALRLAVKLNIFDNPQFFHERDVLMFTKNIEKQEATRRAIVLAAAEIGKNAT